MSKQSDAFEFACYDAIHKLGEPSKVSSVARHLNMPREEAKIRKVLNRLCRLKALSKVKVDGVWRYFI